ncbi:MAG: hypothetical protein AB8G16_19030 [Gammaproteobacteria bacterium]
MNKLFSNKFVVLGMSLAAAVFVYVRIVVPLMPANYDDEPVVEFPDLDDEFAQAAIEPEAQAAQPRLKLATAQYDLRNIDVAMLQFNETPRRDPFIDTPIEAAPLAAVNLITTTPLKKRSTPAARALPILTAVVHSSDQTAAVIDDRIVRLGDRVGNFKVQQIQRDHVVLASANSNQSVQLRVTP